MIIYIVRSEILIDDAIFISTIWWRKQVWDEPNYVFAA